MLHSGQHLVFPNPSFTIRGMSLGFQIPATAAHAYHEELGQGAHGNLAGTFLTLFGVCVRVCLDTCACMA